MPKAKIPQTPAVPKHLQNLFKFGRETASQTFTKNLIKPTVKPQGGLTPRPVPSGGGNEGGSGGEG